MLSQIRNPKPPTLADAGRVPGEFHSVAKQASCETSFFRVPGRFWTDLGRFSDAKMAPKIDFGKFFRDAFFECVLESIANRFREAQNPKNH